MARQVSFVQNNHAGCELSVDNIFLIEDDSKFVVYSFKPAAGKDFSGCAVKHRPVLDFSVLHIFLQFFAKKNDVLKSLSQADFSTFCVLNLCPEKFCWNQKEIKFVLA